MSEMWEATVALLHSPLVLIMLMCIAIGLIVIIRDELDQRKKRK
jgi:hypothetical protein